MDHTSIWQWAARLGAIALAWLCGWLLGRTPPDWRDDVERASGGGFGSNLDLSKLATLFGRGCSSRAWSGGLTAIAAVVLMLFGWPETAEQAELSQQAGDMNVLFYAPFWLLVGAFFTGWIISRVTDKGPVGPLE